MAHFDRFDICAAWNLYLQHHWDDSTRVGRKLLARHSKLMTYFKPAPSEEFVEGLSENALEIYNALCARAES